MNYNLRNCIVILLLQSIIRNRRIRFFQIGTWMRCHFSIRFQSEQNKTNSKCEISSSLVICHFFPNFQTKVNINMHTNTFNEFITGHNFHLFVFQKCRVVYYVECWLQIADWLKKQFPPTLLFANCVLSAIDYSNFLSFSLPFHLILCISGTIIDFYHTPFHTPWRLLHSIKSSFREWLFHQAIYITSFMQCRL